ncbi:MAG: glutamine synthetase type III, partial [Coprobacillus sp.]
TGNKFEFRGVGSAQSIAGPNTTLNTILAEEMEQMAAEIESGKDVMQVIKEFLAEHKRVIFNGDGYSAEWEVEAQRRGLPNNKNSVDAMKCLKDKKNIELFSKHTVYTDVELASRYEILLEGYNKTIQVESLTALKMAKNEIYPAVVSYLNKISKTALNVKENGINNDFLVEDVKILSELLSQMKIQMDDLDVKILSAQNYDGDVMAHAIIWRDDVFTAMNTLRETVDTIETKVDAKYWPMPTYVDLLFGI